MKKLLLPITFIILLFTFLTSCSNEEKSTLEGRYLKSTNDSHMIIVDSSGPIVMTNQSKKATLFDNLKTGDKIKITCTAVTESYPGGCGVYNVTLLERGSIEDINKETLDKLKEMGWIDN